jgi:cell shape-determining protein MreD
MRDKYKNALMWALYAALFLLTLAVQTVVFGRARYFGGAKLSLIPVLVVCTAMLNGAENGGTFALAAGLLWCLSGADGAGLTLMLLTVCAVLAGWLCDRYLRRSLLSALLMSLGALLVCEGGLFLFKYYLGTVGASFLKLLPAQVLLSMLACPPLYGLARAIRKAGA